MTDTKRTWSSRSRRNMNGLHPDLVAVLDASLNKTPFDFVVTEGLRSEFRQRELVNKGASKTMNSRHLTGHAFDIAIIASGGITWEFEAYRNAAKVIKATAKSMGVDLEWGGDWKSFKDGPHFQLSWTEYPKDQWVSHARTPKPRGKLQSRTIQGGGIAGVGATLNQGAQEVATFVDALPEDGGVVTALKWVGFGLTMAGIGAVVYARLDDWNAGHQ